MSNTRMTDPALRDLRRPERRDILTIHLTIRRGRTPHDAG